MVRYEGGKTFDRLCQKWLAIKKALKSFATLKWKSLMLPIGTKQGDTNAAFWLKGANIFDRSWHLRVSAMQDFFWTSYDFRII